VDETDFTAPTYDEEPDIPAGEPATDIVEPAAEQPPLSGPVAMLRDLVYYLATNLVDDPDGVELEVQQRGSTVNLNLFLPEAEVGRVIGRQGRIAKAMRTALMVAGSRHNLRVNLTIES
jgi:predicted RNA-binding protein YlqC (UPF0109 family)